jgi:hypothetical protein
VDAPVGFDELRWLQEVAHAARQKEVPAIIGARLLMRGLVEGKAGSFTLTARGRIALAKLG